MNPSPLWPPLSKTTSALLLRKSSDFPRQLLDDTVTLGGLARDGMARRRAWHDAGILLAEPCTQYSIEKLGDSSEDPTLEELQALLPEVTEKFGLDAVKLMVVQYSRSLKGFSATGGER